MRYQKELEEIFRVLEEFGSKIKIKYTVLQDYLWEEKLGKQWPCFTWP